MKIDVTAYGDKSTEFWCIGCCICHKKQFRMNEAYYRGKDIEWLNDGGTVFLCDQCTDKYNLWSYGDKARIPYNMLPPGRI